MPWERDIYVELLSQHLKEEKEKQEQQQRKYGELRPTDPIDILLEMGIDLDNLSEEEDYLSALKEAIANTLSLRLVAKVMKEVLKLRKKK